MERDIQLNELLYGFSELYWLKPVDIVWDAVNAYHIQKRIGDDEIILDLGCGDGLYSALMFGGRLKISYDRFLNVKPDNQMIRDDQFGDIYAEPVRVNGLIKKPRRLINYGLELKQHHINVATSLGIYRSIIKGRFENIPIANNKIDKIYSVFAFYWGDDIVKQFKEVHRVLRKEGELLVNLPSEFLYDLHIAKKISEDLKYSDLIRNYMSSLDGGRRKLTTRYAKSIEGWREYIEKFGFEIIEIFPVVNELLFFLQDIAQRPFLPTFFKMANEKRFINYRDSVKTYLCREVYPSLIKDLLKYEGKQDVRHGYYLIRASKI